MGKTEFAQGNEYFKTPHWISTSLLGAMIFLGACNSESNEPPPTPIPTHVPRLMMPDPTFCPNRQDYFDVQPNGLWIFTDMETKDGIEFEEKTIEDLHSIDEARSKCNSDVSSPPTFP